MPRETPRPIQASAPGPEAEDLRRAYLDVLKLALCDLVGPSTTSVEGLAGGRTVARELAGDDLRLRAEGRDWPRHALTMSGLRRLDDVQACVEAVVREGVVGDLIEAGCWRGGGSILMRAALDSLGAGERTVWVADSFQGFAPSDPVANAGEYAATLEPYLAVFDFLSAPLGTVEEAFARLGCAEGTRFVPGFFADTLPGLQGRRWSLIRLDADTYDATLLALRCLYPGLAVGGYLLIDDYGALEECREAVERFRSEHDIAEPIETVDWTAVRWRREREQEIEPVVPPPAGDPIQAGPRDGRTDRHIPTAPELELAEEASRLRERLAEAERELAHLGDELREVKTSTSWRLTRPLREAGRYIRARQR